ncbi:hypothetical protein FB107DRAFT_280119 [Schizophyllum commune]
MFAAVCAAMVCRALAREGPRSARIPHTQLEPNTSDEWVLVSDDKRLDENTRTIEELQKALDASAAERQYLESRLEEYIRINIQECECIVCHELTFLPYLLSCGHFVGGECLRQQLDVQGSAAACPLCRHRIDSQPYFSYIMRAKAVVTAEARNETVPPLVFPRLQGIWEKRK